MLLAYHVDVVVKKKLHTNVPISHFETLRCFIYLFLYVMNRTVIYWNTLDAERCFWYQWARSRAGNGGPGAELLLNARSAEGKLLMLHFAHILCRTPPHKCSFLLMTVLQDLTEKQLTTCYKRHCNSLSQAILVAFLINKFLKLSFDYIFWPAIEWQKIPNLLAVPCPQESYQLVENGHLMTPLKESWP